MQAQTSHNTHGDWSPVSPGTHCRQMAAPGGLGGRGRRPLLHITQSVAGSAGDGKLVLGQIAGGPVVGGVGCGARRGQQRAHFLKFVPMRRKKRKGSLVTMRHLKRSSTEISFQKVRVRNVGSPFRRKERKASISVRKEAAVKRKGAYALLLCKLAAASALCKDGRCGG